MALLQVQHPKARGYAFSVSLLKGSRGFEGADVGHRIRVQLVHTDVERGFIDFKRVR
jgi:hypothetical protein